ncbi:RagB/SusD family nutrient uptake outer membrane protein [Pararcticibacter amylolyticus]|uniref:RagB/SusD family nutrient uptake outer membrane protein n=1 Tax=Pararcticibacter amylolyticus TaxID=2173175 RepID=A0A2U2PLT7_9SPHI|nr:RagB/SusD family nutrient uptake outer membrane protein [Pararcticibacter amylolyticus]PWG82254.1 RagB/SusD family nutrient uptake outer membrane protein [Pararcticibacter amylolyticus]
MKGRYFIIAAMALCLSGSGCRDFLDQEPDKILTNDQVYGDPNLIKSVLANFYERVSRGKTPDDKDYDWGQRPGGDLYDFTRLDEAIRYDFDNINQFDRNRWRTYDYKLIRNINQFLQGVKETKVLQESEKRPLEGEARFIRAWCYFNMCRTLGGMPIVGDEVFVYTPGMDITAIQYPRATEAETYDYIISECHAIADMLPAEKNKNSSRANRWTAKMLEARAALYGASLAKYNNQMASPIQTPGREVGIDASKARDYYQKALDAAQYVITNSPYVLQDKRPENKARNFYEAVCVKDNNSEVIWARDFSYPGQTHGFTKSNLPTTLAQDADGNYLSVLLNLVEEYEPVNTTTPGQGSKFEVGTLSSPKFYESADAPFKARDPRLGGTVMYPGSFFVGAEVVLQAGHLNEQNGQWVKREGDSYTSGNGPFYDPSKRLVNKTGFGIRKFLDETPSAGTIGRGSEMWEPHFRIAEAYLIVAEASLELNGGANTITVNAINAVRARAGVQPLTTVTFDNIVHERRVEFAFEDQRYWDMLRWRLADKAWNGSQSNEKSTRRGLWPYRVVSPGDPNNGKWFFEEKDMSFIYPNPLKFELKNYYSELDNSWLNNNPKMVKNPFQ